MNDETQSGWEYKPEGGQEAVFDDTPERPGGPGGRRPAVKTISWEAPEFIERHHGAGWYTALILLTGALAGGIFLISGDLIATVIVALLGIIIGVFAGYKPGLAKYGVGPAGLSVNDKTYKYGDYKSFSIIREGQFSSINMLPLKRFMPPVAAYFEPAEEKKIMNAVGNYLPYEDRQMDTIDRLARRLRL